jgi:hypothetical protein
MEIAKFLPTATGQFCLLSYWLAAGMWAFPSGFPTPFEPFPATVQQPLRAFPSGCWLKRGNFQLFFLKGRISVYIFYKSKEHLKILKTTSGSSSSTDLSNKITFSHSQSHVTVPLKGIGKPLGNAQIPSASQ